MPYVNPIPFVDLGKKFDMRLRMRFDELIPVETARRKMAEYLLQQDPETLASWISCDSIKAVYPDELTAEEKKKFGLAEKASPVTDRKQEEAVPKTEGQDGVPPMTVRQLYEAAAVRGATDYVLQFRHAAPGPAPVNGTEYDHMNRTVTLD